MLSFLDAFFLVFHGLWVGFILFAWMAPRLRGAHLVVCLLTAASWLLLGMRYGWGYCPFTDWHWQVLMAKGETDLPRSYLVYVLDRFAGIEANAALVDGAAVFGLAAAFVISLGLWWRKRAGARRT